MNSSRKRALWILAILLGVTAACLWLPARHRRITINRVRALHIVSDSCEIKLLYGSGILRENDFVYETRRSCLTGDASPIEGLREYLPANDYDAKPLRNAQRPLQKALPGIPLSDYRIYGGMDDPTLTLYYIAVPRTGDHVYIVLRPL